MTPTRLYPFVSIALAAYNGEKYLPEQLDSLLAQDYPNFEIIISDDCSNDRTWEILQSYAIKNDKIKLLPKLPANIGYNKNFIRAFEACGSGLISPCDQDDIWHPNKTRRLVESLSDSALVYCNNRFINEGGAPLGKRLSDVTTMVSGSDPRCLMFGSSICGHAMIFRRDVLRPADQLDAAPYIDLMIAFLAMMRSRIVYLDEVLVDWRHHDLSLSSYNWETSQLSRKKSLEADVNMLSALAQIPGPHQEFIISTNNKLKKWRSSYFDLSMFFFVLRHGHITHLAHRAKHPALKYLFGYKLKKLLRPNYY